MSTMTLMAHTLRSAGYNGLLSLTAAEQIYSGMSWDSVRKGYLLGGGVDLMVSHPDRGQGDDGCHALRQPYDCRDLPWPVECEEPIGPLSSVEQCSDPLQLAMLRAIALCHGEHSFILHNAAGVFGQIDEQHGRPANLWETPGIDAIMSAVRNVEAFMPPNVGTGRHWNNENENPFRVQTIWPEDGRGTNRRYCVEHADGFVCPVFGLVPAADFVCRQTTHVEAFDPVRGAVVQKADVLAGSVMRLEPTTLDQFGHGGLIVRGTFL